MIERAANGFATIAQNGRRSMKPILDACCGSRMFWFDQHNSNVLFVDNRRMSTEAIWKSGNGTGEAPV